MKQKIYKFACCLVAAFLVLCSFSVPSFAISSDDFSVLYNSEAVSRDTYLEGITFCTTDNSNYPYGNVCTLQTDVPFYAFVCNNILYICSESSVSGSVGKVRCNYYQSNTGNGVSVTKFNSTYNIYYGTYTCNNLNNTYLCPVFSSLDDGFSALRDFIDNSSRSIHTIPVSPSSPYVFGSLNGVDYLTHVTNDKLAACANLNDTLIVASLSSSAIIQAGYQQSSGSSSFLMSDVSLSPVSVSDNTLYVGSYNPVDVVYSSDLKTFTDSNSCYSDLYNYLVDNGGVPDPPAVNYNFTTPVDVEPGTVLYVGVNAGQTLTLSGTTRFPYRSALLGGDFPQSSQRLAQASSLPVGDVQFPLANSISIPWVKADPLNILGQSFNAQFSADALANSSILTFSNNGFLTIYNPYYVNVEGFNNAGNLNENTTLHLNISGYSSLRTYSVQDQILHGTDPDGYDKSWAGNITDNGNGTGSVSWEAESASGADTSSMSSTPSNSNYNGGGVPSSESIIQGIANTLTNFANSLISLVSSPISHINQLISSGSGFMNGLRGLYSWLPGDIQNHLISALTLVITIGVFKVFL